MNKETWNETSLVWKEKQIQRIRTSFGIHHDAIRTLTHSIRFLTSFTCHEFDEYLLASLFTYLKCPLRTLKLISPRGLNNTIFERIQQFAPTLKTLALCRCSNTAIIKASYLPFIARLSKLRKIDLYNSMIDGSADFSLLVALKQLSILNLNRARITNLQFHSLSTYPSLTSLSLSSCDSLSSLAFSSLPVPCFHSLQCVDWSDNMHIGSGVEMSFLRHCTRLQSIEGSYSNMDDLTLSYLLSLSHLHTLDMECTSITYSGLISFLYSATCKLSVLYIKGIKYAPSTIPFPFHSPVLTHLTKLNIDGEYVNDAFIVELCKYVKRIEACELSTVPLTDDGLHCIAQNWSHLQSLRLFDCPYIHDTGILSFLSHPSLLSLTIVAVPHVSSTLRQLLERCENETWSSISQLYTCIRNGQSIQ